MGDRGGGLEVLERIFAAAAPIHVTALAAASLRAVDPQLLNQALGTAGGRRMFTTVREAAIARMESQDGAGNRISPRELSELAQLRPPVGAAAGDLAAVMAWEPAQQRVVWARAIAHALHVTRSTHFWSYFASWTEPRLLAPGDPFPVPITPTLPEIFPKPLHLSPCPDTIEIPLCPGGADGLPSLRLMPMCDADVFLDPRLPRTLSPMIRGVVSVVVPAEHLDARYEYRVREEPHLERSFDRVTPRPTGEPPSREAAVAALCTDVLEELRRVGREATIAMLPELTSTPEIDDAVGAAFERGELGNLQVLVLGSAWVEPLKDGEPGSNRSTIWLRGGGRGRHFKFSWFHDRTVGTELIERGRKQLTIYAGPHQTFATLICKDALEPWTTSLLAALRVRLVFVPSCNPGVETYRAVIAGLSHQGQVTVVLANIPPDRRGPSEYALAARPAAHVIPPETGRVDVLRPIDGYKASFYLEVFQTVSI